MHEIKFAYESPSCSTSPDNIGETDNTPPLTALSDDTYIPAAHRSGPDFKDTVEYLDTGTLPDSDVAARKVILESDQYTMVDGRLHHLYTPRHKNKHKVHPVIQQLCLPQTLRNDVTKAYHDNNGHTKGSSALINSTSPSDRNIIGHVCMPTYLATSAVAYSASTPNNPHITEKHLYNLCLLKMFLQDFI